eukprot:CAMPEP_0204279558 /NCGR_PEP_ID=MMETSP0468-20130131/35496_1 /ASSEMBLY_ACC=CAM_ASM_000383 /TAXON_ID=2969 /ORGANISM="Oxyrrhis marina" /LENGTH=174 /DNA_ID=CAMNT_0051256673 /DNA_START=150 /DNA_END=674 /DNA_ORIENTATION=-
MRKTAKDNRVATAVLCSLAGIHQPWDPTHRTIRFTGSRRRGCHWLTSSTQYDLARLVEALRHSWNPLHNHHPTRAEKENVRPRIVTPGERPRDQGLIRLVMPPLIQHDASCFWNAQRPRQLPPELPWSPFPGVKTDKEGGCATVIFVPCHSVVLEPLPELAPILRPTKPSRAVV